MSLGFKRNWASSGFTWVLRRRLQTCMPGLNDRNFFPKRFSKVIQDLACPLRTDGLSVSRGGLLGSLGSSRRLSAYRSFVVCGSFTDKSDSNPLLVSAAQRPDNPAQRKSTSFKFLSKPKRLKDLFLRSLLYRFLTNIWGAAVTFCFYRNLQRTLSLSELAFVKVQQHRIFSLAPAKLHTLKQRERYPWANGFMAIYLAVRYRDPALLLHWLQTRVRVMSMFAHLRFFRILGLVLKSTILPSFGKHRLKGFSFYLVGKISVTGNAMSRAYRSFAGKRGNSNLALRLATGFNIIRTPTGCLGFTLSFFF